MFFNPFRFLFALFFWYLMYQGMVRIKSKEKFLHLFSNNENTIFH